MRYLVGTLGVLGLLGGLALFAPREPVRDQEVTRSIPDASPADPNVYTLTSPEAEQSCTIRRVPVASAGGATLSVPADCDTILPGLSTARFWTERSDGSVSFSSDGGAQVALFAVADGMAYESISPSRPLMALATSD